MKVATTVPGALKLLWKSGFFRKPKTRPQIEVHLEEMGYNFAGNALSMALAAARFLTRRGPRGSYSFVQKHPFLEDNDGEDE